MTIGMRIKELRKLNNLNQAELANLLNLKQSTIANYEKDLRKPQLEVIIHLSKLFKTTTDYLMMGNENENSIISQGDRLTQAMLDRHEELASEIIEKYLEANGLTALYLTLFRYVLTKVGWLWEIELISISEEHRISNRINHYIEKYKPLNKNKGKKIVGFSVEGDIHTLGLKMLLHLASKDHDCHYLGGRLPIDDLMTYIKKESIDLVVISISSPLLHDKLSRTIDQLSLPVLLTGYGLINYDIKHPNVISTNIQLKDSLEALNE